MYTGDLNKYVCRLARSLSSLLRACSYPTVEVYHSSGGKVVGGGELVTCDAARLLTRRPFSPEPC